VLASILNITQRKQAELEAARQRIDVAHSSRVSLLVKEVSERADLNRHR
jgi:hypothetical protein